VEPEEGRFADLREVNGRLSRLCERGSAIVGRFSESLAPPEELAAVAAEVVWFTMPFDMAAKPMKINVLAAPRTSYRLRHAYSPLLLPRVCP
jgi:hypothetical protein